MKSLNKKISVVVLIGSLLIGSGFSQGFIAHASYGILNHNLLKNPDDRDIGDIFSYSYVAKNQNKHDYDAIYLGSHSEFYNKFVEKVENSFHSKYKHKRLIPKRYKSRHPFLEPGVPFYLLLEFNDELDFAERVSELSNYRPQGSIIIRVGSAYFKIIFGLNRHESNVIPMKVIAHEFGFNIGYAENNDWYGNIVMESFLDKNPEFNNKEYLRNILKKQPIQDGVNKFQSAESFSDYLKSKLRSNQEILPRGFSRYRVKDYDYIIYYK